MTEERTDCLFEGVPLNTRVDYIQSVIDNGILETKLNHLAIKHRRISIIHSICVIILVIVEVPALCIIAYKMLGY